MDIFSDNELFLLALEENEDAKNVLFTRYKYIIDILMKKYVVVANHFGIDKKDLYAEGLFGFSDALARFNQDRSASLPTFISLCVNRRMYTQVLKAGREKNKLNWDSYSLDYNYEQFGSPLHEILSDEEKNDPLKNMTCLEDYQELIVEIKNDLSSFEYSVFSFVVNGFDYNQIAAILKKSPKQIDNTIQRLRLKVKKIMECREKA